MDVCTETCSMAWLSLMRGAGLLGPDMMMDTRALLVEDGIEQCIRDVQAREEDLDKQLRSTLAEARDALKKGQRGHARTCTTRCQRYSLQLHRLRGMLDTLHTHKDVIDTTQLNMSVVGALKRSAVALATWKKGTTVQNVSEVDRVRQDLEDNMRAAHELIEVAASPMDIPGDERYTDADLDELLQQMESEVSAATAEDPAPPLLLPTPPSARVELAVPSSTIRARTALPA